MEIKKQYEICEAAITDLEEACMDCCSPGHEDFILEFVEQACECLRQAVASASCSGEECDPEVGAETEPFEVLTISVELDEENQGVRCAMYTPDGDLMQITPFFDVKKETNDEFEIGDGLVEALKELTEQVARKSNDTV